MFDEISLKGFKVKNHIVRSATNDYRTKADGVPVEEQFTLYEDLAKNDIGLIFTGHLFVSLPYAKVKDGQTGIYDDSLIEPLARLAAAGKQNGARIVAQINHAGAKSLMVDVPLGPSATDLIGNGTIAKELSKEEIKGIEKDFAAAALRAKKAGFDGIQLHLAHGYLLSQFIDPAINKRTDEYGGNAQNRFRFAEETLHEIKALVGDDFPIFVKINSDTSENNAQYENDLIYMLNQLDELGVKAAELSGYIMARTGEPTGPYFIERAKRVKKATNIPLILVGGMCSLEDAQTALDAGMAMASFCRPLISEPDLIPKLVGGQEKSRCIHCNHCFTDGKCILAKA